MDFFKKHKILVGIIIVVLAFVVYSIFTKDSDEDLVSAEIVVERTPARIAEEDLIELLSDLQAISLNGAIFESELFKGLVDFGQELPLQPVGRSNPFAPFGL